MRELLFAFQIYFSLSLNLEKKIKTLILSLSELFDFFSPCAAVQSLYCYILGENPNSIELIPCTWLLNSTYVYFILH